MMKLDVPGLADGLPSGPVEIRRRNEEATGRSTEEQLAQFLAEQDAESPLTQYVQILLRRRWIVLAGIALGLLVALAITYTTRPLYRASTTLEIAREASRVLNTEGVEPRAMAMNLEFYQTQYGLLKSRSLATTVVKRLRLAENDTLLYGYEGDNPPESNGGPPSPERRAQLERRAAGIVLANLVVSPVRASSLVEISFSSPDPALSAKVANAFAESFIASNLARRFDASAYARKFLEDRLTQVRSKLEESERALVNYASRERIINLDSPGAKSPGSAEGEGQSLAAADLNALNAALAAAKAERVSAEARFAEAQRGGGLSLPQTLQDPASTALRGARADLSAQYSKLLQQYKPDYPSMIALKQQIGELDRQLAGTAGGIVSSLRNEYAVANKRESELQRQVDQLKDNVLDLRRRSIQYNIFQRDADTNRTLYDGLLQRYKEVGISGGIGTNNVSVVDPALVPGGPFTPKPMLNITLGLIVGLLLGGMAAFLLEQLDESIIAPDDLENKLGTPLLGNIPRVANGSDTYSMLSDRKSPLAEAYLSVQTSLRFSTRHGAPRAILVTSSRPSEGKSTTAIAIARNFASLDRKVVLIDGDMRNPSVHRVVSLSNNRGLSDALAGGNDITALIQPSGIDGLGVITSGPLPPNPAELLAGDRLEQLVESLLKQFDHVVIDGPPVVGLADAPLIASYVEATVFVIAASETRTRAARLALRRLSDVHAHIVGAILTKFDARTIGYDYGYEYNYGAKGSRRSKA
jgi:capsular exopolysaccharide synthesis family protein